MPSSDEASQYQRQRILTAVAELVAKRGYGDTTIERISKAAGVGAPTFHKHFEDKEECFLAAFDQAVEAATRRATEAADAAGEEWAERVRAGLVSLLESIVAEPMLARICLVESLTAGPTAVDRYETAIRKAVPILRQGRELNTGDDKLPKAIEETLSGGIAWTVQQRLATDGVKRIRELEPQILQIIFAPYLGESAAKRLTAGARSPT